MVRHRFIDGPPMRASRASDGRRARALVRAMRFDVLARDARGVGARAGRLRDDRARAATPCALAATSKGAPHALTDDVLADVEARLRARAGDVDADGDGFGLAVCSAHARADGGGVGKRKREDGGGAGRARGTRRRDAGRAAVGHYRDAIWHGLDLREGSKELAVACESGCGRRWLTSREHAEGARELGARAACALADERGGRESERRAMVRVERTMLMLEETVREVRASGVELGILATLVGGESVAARERSSALTAEFIEREKARDVVVGYALGGFFAGEDASTRGACVEASLKHVNAREDAFVYLPGSTTVEDVIDNIERGVDVFDASWASETAARGRAFCFPVDDTDVTAIALAVEGRRTRATNGGDAYSLNLWAAAYKTDFTPFLPAASCTCPACAEHTKAYVHHLLQSHEMTATVLLEAHNLFRWCAFFSAARRAIRAGTWRAFAAFHRAYASASRT